ncbi:MAG: RcnB family protein [Pantoea sp.]|nr:RcnB family protein [Pantoea sp.]
MKKTTLRVIATFIACSSLISTLSWADGPGDHHGQPWQQHDGNRHDGDRHDDRGRGRDHFAWNGHDFRRGHPMPHEYRGPHYRVDDWRERRLPEPPRGEYWSYIDGNYVLIAAATGIITSLILGNAFN